ncbi:MAG: uracil-DNA glycosylase [Lentisphaerae bacterium]|nr:uracil-DNA glycosylase [Lentisphaerota bacterium]
MALAHILDGLADYLQHRIEEGERWAEISPATLAALRQPAGALHHSPAPARTAPAIAPPASPRPVPAAPPPVAPAPDRTPRAAPPPTSVPVAHPPPAPPATRAPATPAVATDRAPYTRFGTTPALDAIASRVAACQQCGLCKQRQQVVPGQGNPHPELVFVGEGPGADEDQQGLAFVGRAGQLLTRMILAMGLTREDVWIGNVVKCRPPENRTPLPDEMAACLPYLRAQLEILQPKVIVALGATALKGLLDVQTGITKLRGHWLSFEGIDVMPTYHPSYLLRSGGDSGASSRYWDVWEDLSAVLQRLGRPVPARKKPAPPAG